MVSEKKKKLSFSHYKYKGANDPGVWPVWAPGAWLAGFMYVTTKQCYILNMKAMGLMISEKIFLCFSHYISMGANDLGHGQFGPKGLDWQDLCRGILNITTYYIYKLLVSWFQKIFFSFSHYKSMGANDPRGVVSLGNRGLIGRINVGDH